MDRDKAKGSEVPAMVGVGSIGAVMAVRCQLFGIDTGLWHPATWMDKVAVWLLADTLGWWLQAAEAVA